MRQNVASERMVDPPRTHPAIPGGVLLRGTLARIGPGARSFRTRQIYRNEVYDPFAPSAPLGARADNSGLRRYLGCGDALASGPARYELVWAKGGNITFLRRP